LELKELTESLRSRKRVENRVKRIVRWGMKERGK